MSPTSVYVERARVASLCRSRPANDPDLVDARTRMQEEVLVNAIDRALQKAPPMTVQLRDRIISLLAVGKQQPTKASPSQARKRADGSSPAVDLRVNHSTKGHLRQREGGG